MQQHKKELRSGKVVSHFAAVAANSKTRAAKTSSSVSKSETRSRKSSDQAMDEVHNSTGEIRLTNVDSNPDQDL